MFSITIQFWGTESDFLKTKRTFQTSFRGKRSILRNAIASFRFRLRFIGYPFVLKQVENEEEMSCMFLLIFHGQTKSETFTSFLKNLTLAKINWCHANFWAVNSKVLGFVDPFPPWSSMVYWMHQKILPSKVKQC